MPESRWWQEAYQKKMSKKGFAGAQKSFKNQTKFCHITDIFALFIKKLEKIIMS